MIPAVSAIKQYIISIKYIEYQHNNNIIIPTPVTRFVIDDNAVTGNLYIVTWGDTGLPVLSCFSVYDNLFLSTWAFILYEKNEDSKNVSTNCITCFSITW